MNEKEAELYITKLKALRKAEGKEEFKTTFVTLGAQCGKTHAMKFAVDEWARTHALKPQSVPVKDITKEVNEINKTKEIGYEQAGQ